MHLTQDQHISQLLKNTKTIAVVGHSDRPQRTSYNIANYLRRAGFTVIPVNPTVESINGETSYPTVQAIPHKVDLVNVFRRSQFLPDIVQDAIAAGAPAIWTQLGVIHQEAAHTAVQNNLQVVTNRCIMVEHRRLLPTLQ